MHPHSYPPRPPPPTPRARSLTPSGGSLAWHSTKRLQSIFYYFYFNSSCHPWLKPQPYHYVFQFYFIVFYFDFILLRLLYFYLLSFTLYPLFSPSCLFPPGSSIALQMTVILVSRDMRQNPCLDIFFFFFSVLFI